MRPRPSFAAVVLAAGSGTRFGGHPGSKLLADLDGETVLSRVLDTLRSFEPACTVVVIRGEDDGLDHAIEWQGEMRVRNHLPELGLSSSLQTGLHALTMIPEPLDGAFLVLGDQPLLRLDTLRALEAAATSARPADRPLVVPRYEDRGPRNPVLLLRPAWSWVEGLEGDAGLSALIGSNPDQVLEVPVAGSMPDVDTPDDLERLRDR